MSSTDELLRDVDSLTDDDIGSSGEPEESDTSAERESRSRRAGFRSRLPSPSSWFSPRGFLVALVLTVGGFLLGSFVPIPFVGGLAGLLGIFVAGFALGVVGRRRYLEVALAGALTAGVGFLLNQLVLSMLAGFAVPLTLVGAGAGTLAAVLGHYFGRDLYAGLTQDI